MIPLDSLSRSSAFWLIMKRENGSLYPMQFKFRKFNKRANSCEWSRFGTSIQDIHRQSTIDYVSKKSFQNVHETWLSISSTIPAE